MRKAAQLFRKLFLCIVCYEVMALKKNLSWIAVCLLTSSVALLGAFCFGNAVSAINEMAALPRKYRIIIDAGHGSPDGGAISCTGKPESSYNLEIALRMNDLLHLLGYETIMIRTEDVSVYTEGSSIGAKKVSDLKNRVSVCNGTENGILLSIHQNTFPDGKYSGSVVLYGNIPGSRELAEQIQGNLIKILNPGSNRRCKPADGIYLMERVKCPAVLIECGFLSNVAEEAMLRTDSYQKKLCCVIVSSLSGFLRTETAMQTT